jgi:hypothetical protein
MAKIHQASLLVDFYLRNLQQGTEFYSLANLIPVDENNTIFLRGTMQK